MSGGGSPIPGGGGSGITPQGVSGGPGNIKDIQKTLDTWLSPNLSVSMSLGDQDAVNPPPEFHAQHPTMRFNYVDIPWGASIPATGCILLHSDQLAQLEARLNTPWFPLVLKAQDRDTGKVLYAATLWSFTLYRAIPLAGAHEGDYQSNPAGTNRGYGSDGGSSFAEAPAGTTGSFVGLWLVYFADYRALRMMRLTNTSFNMTDVTGRRLTNSSINLDAAFTHREIAQHVFDDMKVSADPVTFNVPDVTRSPLKPRNMNFRNVPSPMALDITLHQTGYVFFENLLYTQAENQAPKRFRFDDLTKVTKFADTHAAIKTFKQLRMFGGTQRVYPLLNIPGKYSVVFNKVSRYGTRPYPPESTAYDPTEAVEVNSSYQTIQNGTPDADSRIALCTGAVVDENTTTAEKEEYANAVAVAQGNRHAFAQGNMSFHGWLTDFLNYTHISMISFQLNRGMPITTLELMGANPMGALAKRRMDHELRGEPYHVGVNTNGTLSWEPNEEGIVTQRQIPQFFLGKITSRAVDSDTTGGNQLVKVAPLKTEVDNWFADASVYNADVETTLEVTAYSFLESHLVVGDPVLCFYTGTPGVRWVAMNMPPVRVAGKFDDPPASCQCDPDDTCEDSTITPVTITVPDGLLEG